MNFSTHIYNLQLKIPIVNKTSKLQWNNTFENLTAEVNKALGRLTITFFVNPIKNDIGIFEKKIRDKVFTENKFLLVSVPEEQTNDKNIVPLQKVIIGGTVLEEFNIHSLGYFYNSKNEKLSLLYPKFYLDRIHYDKKRKAVKFIFEDYSTKELTHD